MTTETQQRLQQKDVEGETNRRAFQKLTRQRRVLTIVSACTGFRLRVRTHLINCEWPPKAFRIKSGFLNGAVGMDTTIVVNFPISRTRPDNLAIEPDLRGLKFAQDADYFQGTLDNGMHVSIVLE